MKWYLWGAVVLLYSLFGSACSTERRYDLSAYGLSPVENVDNAPAMARALEQIREKCEENQTIVVTLPKGRYLLEAHAHEAHPVVERAAVFVAAVVGVGREGS